MDILTKELDSTFILNDKTYQVVKGHLASQCYYCSLRSIKCYTTEIIEITGSCSPTIRKDKTAIIFKEVI